MWSSGIFSASYFPSFPPPRGIYSTTSRLSNCGFCGFQIYLQAPTINLAKMDTTRPKITFGVVGERSLLGISPVELDTTGDDGIDDSLPIELRIWLVPKQFTSSNNQLGSRMATSQSKNKIWCDRRALPSLY
jgi:hypothetical protein